jgi:hypothetical protein
MGIGVIGMDRRFAVALLAAACAMTPADPTSADESCIPLETFENATVGAFPPGWQVRKDAGKQVYRVEGDGARRFLRADSNGLGIQAAKEREWNLDEYPVLAWSWRPRQLPNGADERTGKNDSVLSVYLLVPYSRIRGPKAVKYVWSAVVPVGTRLESNGGLTQVRVLRTANAPSDAWVDERVNVRDDWKAYFEERKTPTPAGIAVLTDADDTHSRASGDYASFRACRQ